MKVFFVPHTPEWRGINPHFLREDIEEWLKKYCSDKWFYGTTVQDTYVYFTDNDYYLLFLLKWP